MFTWSTHYSTTISKYWVMPRFPGGTKTLRSSTKRSFVLRRAFSTYRHEAIESGWLDCFAVLYEPETGPLVIFNKGQGQLLGGVIVSRLQPR